MIRLLILSIFTFSILCFSYALPNRENKSGYQLAEPDARYILPDSLNEISGIAIIDQTTLACVQDEKGIVFIYDPSLVKIKHQYPFNLDGDYEGICLVGETIYILRSDGVLMEMTNYTTDHAGFTIYQTGIPAFNNEGLCYDAANNRLLIACKSTINKEEKENKDKRMVYAFDLLAKTTIQKPVFVFDVEEIKQFANDLNLDLPEREKKKDHSKEIILKYRPSAIGIHPITKNIYILSAVDHLLFIFHPDGKLLDIEQLNEKLFNKSEGIAFYPNGDMLITNEAQENHPTLLYFKYHPE